MLFLAAIALLFCGANASLSDYQHTLLKVPNCGACRTTFDVVVNHYDAKLKSGNYDTATLTESFRSSLTSVCKFIPTAIWTEYPGTGHLCNQFEEMEISSTTSLQICALVGFCENGCQFCEARVAGGWQTVEHAQNFCQAFTNYQRIALADCTDEMSRYSADNALSQADNAEVLFCNSSEKIACDTTGEYVQPNLISTQSNHFCGKGYASVTYETYGAGNYNESHLNALDEDLTIGYHFSDLKHPSYVCACEVGYSRCEVAGRDFCCDAAGNPSVGAQFLERIVRYEKRKAFIRSKPIKEDQIMSAIEMAKQEHVLEQRRVAEELDCSGNSWTYFMDSPVDGVTFNFVGPWSDHEYYTFAYKQDADFVTIAINTNLYPEGQPMAGANGQGDVVVAMGDWFFNKRQGSGLFLDLETANRNNVLHGVHMDVENDNAALPLGVYQHTKFVSVANSNNGFSEVEEYIDFIHNMDSANNNIAPFLKFGGGIDEAADNGLGYLSNEPLNVIDMENSGTFAGPLNGAVEYYIHDGFDEQSHLDAIYVRDVLGLNWEQYGGTGVNTRLFSFNRTFMPHDESDYLVHVVAECFNDVIAGVVRLCEVPSKSPSNSRTPSRTPSFSPTRTPSRTPSRTNSPTSAPSQSSSRSPIVERDIGEFCEGSSNNGKCLHFNDAVPNTFVLGDFNGTSDTQGQLFICGNGALIGYSVSSSLEVDITRDDLIVSGNLDFETGRVHGGNIVVAGEANIGSSVYHGMYNRTVKRVDNPLDCQRADSYYTLLSDAIGSIESTGIISIAADGTIEASRIAAEGRTVFDIDCSVLSSVRSVYFHTFSPAVTAIVNFHGETCTFDGFSMKGDINTDNVIFNFPETTTLNFKQSSLPVSFLAPRAEFIGSGGVIKGSIVVAKWTGSTQQNMAACTACLPNISDEAVTANLNIPLF